MIRGLIHHKYPVGEALMHAHLDLAEFLIGAHIQHRTFAFLALIHEFLVARHALSPNPHT